MKQYNTKVSREEVAALLAYDPQTGLFTHKVNGHKRSAGAVTGRIDTKGYVRIRLLGYEFKAHRLAWLLTYGLWPTAEIDHINGIKSDNRICNLREANRFLNMQNQRVAKSDSLTGILGVTFHKRDGIFTARIRHEGKLIHIGSFKDKESASAAYLSAKRKLHQGCTI